MKEQQDLEAAEAYAEVHSVYKRELHGNIVQDFLAGCRHKEAQLASDLAAKDADIARMQEECDEWERVARSWNADYDKLKEKYEPMIAVISSPADKAGMGEE